jgi:hypothetical protein
LKSWHTFFFGEKIYFGEEFFCFSKILIHLPHDSAKAVACLTAERLGFALMVGS